MATQVQRVALWIVMVSLGLAAVGCSGGSDGTAQSAAPAEPAGIVCDHFELRWEVDGEDLLLAIDTTCQTKASCQSQCRGRTTRSATMPSTRGTT